MNLIGCQARPWLQTLGRDELAHRLPDVMAHIADIGFRGFETALNVLPLHEPLAFRDATARANGLILVGAHTGGRWWDPHSTATVASVVALAKQLPALGCQRLVVSMAPPPVESANADLNHATRTLDQLGRACREEAGVSVVFHNHAAELADDALFIRTLVDNCAPENVALGPDLGWVAYAGVNVVEFVQRFGSRIAYLHVRDVTQYGPEGSFIEIGRGVLDHAAILAALRAHDYRGWLVAESEFYPGSNWSGATDPRVTASLQLSGLRLASGA